MNHSLTSVRASGAKPLMRDISAADLMHARQERHPFSRPGWLFEIKFDGFRALAIKDGKEIELLSRSNKSLAPAFPEVVAAVAALPVDAVLDCELTVLEESGRPRFDLLQSRARKSRPLVVQAAAAATPAMLIVFDALAIERYDVRPLPLRRRKDFLMHLVPSGANIRPLEGIEEQGEALFEKIDGLQLEGMVCKRLDSPYVALRSEHWIKVRTGHAEARDWRRGA